MDPGLSASRKLIIASFLATTNQREFKQIDSSDHTGWDALVGRSIPRSAACLAEPLSFSALHGNHEIRSLALQIRVDAAGAFFVDHLHEVHQVPFGIDERRGDDRLI